MQPCEDNDPHGEHDFGAFDIEGAGTIFWKIDYYADKSCATGSENPADPAQSFRILRKQNRLVNLLNFATSAQMQICVSGGSAATPLVQRIWPGTGRGPKDGI
jgi:hypothetical protein